MKYLFLILILFSCSPTRNITNPVTVTLDGSKSYDPDGQIAKWFWRQVTSGNSVFITYPTRTITPVVLRKRGRYLFELVVTDNNGATGKDTCVIIY